ncbi:hypothetical protein EAF04_004785 [Stromatinia cepivora]|nr:hypothetical protein EAF04_004785 [Stromatinia cepivora]
MVVRQLNDKVPDSASSIQDRQSLIFRTNNCIVNNPEYHSDKVVPINIRFLPNCMHRKSFHYHPLSAYMNTIESYPENPSRNPEDSRMQLKKSLHINDTKVMYVNKMMQVVIFRQGTLDPEDLAPYLPTALRDMELAIGYKKSLAHMRAQVGATKDRMFKRSIPNCHVVLDQRGQVDGRGPTNQYSPMGFHYRSTKSFILGNET